MSAQSNVWPSVNLLRGLAVVCMLVNHSTVELLGSDDFSVGLSGVLFFLGSFAPVLFFFTTGFGYGLAHEVGFPAKTKDLAVKVSLLVAIDFFMRGGDFSTFGWDFLAFIAFSMLLLHCLRGRRFGVEKAVFLLLLVLGLRFGVGWFYNGMDADEQNGSLRVLLGLSALPGVSYWFTPWFAYPLLGFIFGVFARKNKQLIEDRRFVVSFAFLLSGVIASVVTAYLESKGMVIFRWSSVSLNFFNASIACILISLGIVWLLDGVAKFDGISRLVSLKGVSSLAIVPIHYLLLDLVSSVPFAEHINNYFYPTMLVWIFICYLLAKLTDSFAGYLSRADHALLIRWTVISTAFIVFICLTAFPALDGSIIILFVIQYLLCILLKFNYSSRKAL